MDLIADIFRKIFQASHLPQDLKSMFPRKFNPMAVMGHYYFTPPGRQNGMKY
jgi:hypothetical protein